MTILFLSSYLNGDIEMLHRKIIIVVALYIVVLLAVFFDLISGIRKSKKNDEFISSFGLRKTVAKLIKYYNILLIFTMIDVVLSIFPIINIPFLTAFGVIWIGIIEGRSIWEKYPDKQRVHDAAKTLKVVVENKEDLAKILEEFMKKEQENEENTKDKAEDR